MGNAHRGQANQLLECKSKAYPIDRTAIVAKRRCDARALLRRNSPYLTVLDNTLPSPLAPESDDEKAKNDSDRGLQRATKRRHFRPAATLH